MLKKKILTAHFNMDDKEIWHFCLNNYQDERIFVALLEFAQEVIKANHKLVKELQDATDPRQEKSR